MSAHPGEGTSPGTDSAHYFSRLIGSAQIHNENVNFGVGVPRAKLRWKRLAGSLPSTTYCLGHAGAPVWREASQPAREGTDIIPPARLELFTRHSLLLVCSLLEAPQALLFSACFVTKESYFQRALVQLCGFDLKSISVQQSFIKPQPLLPKPPFLQESH